MTKIIVGMSGGVDSAVAAVLLKKAGYEVIGLTLRTWTGDDGTESRCCEIDDARNVARKLGIPYYTLNCLSDFQKHVIDPFVQSYMQGQTPNPCVICNRLVKWERMLYFAKVMQADCVATGHYASVVQLPNGRYTVQKAVHAEKDQTYMLYRLSQEQLAATRMPLGGLTKEEVRRIAEQEGLPVAQKPDSQEICFVTDGNYADFIEKNTSAELPGEGCFTDEDGNVLGTHKGIIHYTPGQRKGLGLALGYPAYVKRIDTEKNEVIIGKEESLYSTELQCRDVNFMSIPEPETGSCLSCAVKIRYHHPAQKAILEQQENGLVRIRFDKPVRAAAPGQSAVFYDAEERVIGGGVIMKD